MTWGNLLIIILEISFFFYCGYESVKLFKGGPKVGVKKKLSRAKLLAYLLIMSCIAINLFCQFNAIYSVLWETEATENTLNLICETLATLILFSLTTDLAFFWYELYSCLEENSRSFDIRISRIRNYFIILNFTIYACAGVLMGIYLIFGVSQVLIALFAVLLTSFTGGATLFIIQGIKLYKKTSWIMAAVPKKFLPLFSLSILCFLTKIAYHALCMYDSYKAGEGFDGVFFYLHKDSLSFSLLTFLYLIGEFGSMFSLVLLLKTHTKQNKVSMTSTLASTFIEEEGEYISEDDYANYVKEPRGDISVSLIN